MRANVSLCSEPTQNQILLPYTNTQINRHTHTHIHMHTHTHRNQQTDRQRHTHTHTHMHTHTHTNKQTHTHTHTHMHTHTDVVLFSLCDEATQKEICYRLRPCYRAAGSKVLSTTINVCVYVYDQRSYIAI